jgi:hypothetical protein
MATSDTLESLMARLREGRRASRAARIARGDKLAMQLEQAELEGERIEREQKARERERERARLLDLLGEDAPQHKRQRKPSDTTLIKRARKAGERGPVTITLPDGRSITTEREGGIEASDDTPNEWDRLQ